MAASQPNLRAIDAVGHRVVHGADRFTDSVLIDDAVIAELEALCEIAPLHNPGAVSGIRAARKIFGDAVPMVAAFDTSFHHMIPENAALYAIPYELSQKHKIRRYGFHGLAHRYDVGRYAELIGKPVAQVSPSRCTWATAARRRRFATANRWTRRWALRRSKAW